MRNEIPDVPFRCVFEEGKVVNSTDVESLETRSIDLLRGIPI